MKSILVTCFLILPVVALTQDARELVNAERSFAEMARTQSIKEAFMTFMSDSGMVFSQGRALRAKDIYNKRPSGNDLLSWHPVYAELASSGDFGFTTGPYKYFKSKNDSVALAHGYYSTVWHRDGNGNWRALVDMGVVYQSEHQPEPALRAYKVPDQKMKGQSQEFGEFSLQYLQQLNELGKSFVGSAFSENGRLHRNSKHPVVSLRYISKVDDDILNYAFERLGSGIASSKDMGYVYGTLKKVVDDKTVIGNFLHVWRKQDATWKLVLDVITF